MTTSNDTVLGTAVICTALDVEYRAVREHLDGPFDEREKNGTLYQVGTFATGHGRWVVALAQTGAGNTQAGIELERAISVFHPQIVLFVGVAGGRKDVEPGDVVVADEIYDYESGKDTASEFLPRIKTKAPAHRLIERAKAVARDDAWQHRILPTTPHPAPKAVIKPIAAGSKVIADQNAATARYLATYCGDAAAVEMEGYGFLHGTYVNDTVQALVVRGISDLLSGKTETADAHWQPTASSHAAAFAFELLARHTTPPNPAAGSVPQQLVAAPASFVGRADQLAELDRALNAAEGSSPGVSLGGGGTAVISAIGGTGGIGKTWLALTWAHRNLHHFPDGQLSADLRGFSSGEPRHAVDVLADFLAALGVDRDHQPTELDARIALYRTRTTGKRMLILLDNAATPEHVEPLLAGGSTCTVLITSRDRLRGLVTRHSARPVRIDVLSETEARTLFTTALEDAHGCVTADAEQAFTELIGLCGGFPLALGLIAARIRTAPELLDDLVTDLRDLGLDALDSGQPAASLPTVLSWSLRHLNDQQRTLFGLLGIAPGPDTALPAVASLIDLPSASAHKALSALEEASLIARRPHTRYAMHDLVREYAISVAANISAETRAGALRRIIDFYTHTAHAAEQSLDSDRDPPRLNALAAGVHPCLLPNTAAALAWFETEYACLLAAQHTATTYEWYPTVWLLAWSLSTFQRMRGYTHDQLAVWQAAANAAAHLPDLTTRIRIYRTLGYIHADLRQHGEAFAHLHRALTLAEQQHDLAQQAHTHRALTRAWEHQGDDQQALEHARCALNLYRHFNRPGWEAVALNAVGWYSARLEDYDTAREHCQLALALHRYNKNPHNKANSFDVLGYIDQRTGQYAQAINRYTCALILFRDFGDNYAAADVLDRLGHPHAALGQFDEALASWQEALQLYRKQDRTADAERVQRQLNELDNPGDSVALDLP
ncbi:phosphorylase family protein [Amycolatopsis vastitatis]|uniref:Nucleoside phosphorylase domain-containing protein n=1 Tax=Amycolatopsis vastitatis TaxID=1905142 RepID=A0A229SL13_9PSEU|nr:tetratricopeptide repeat protein [Amycolatopsis vastitatis]OXM59645.1 hypothetical protein CF165_46470 [Amycolatopsis vastitatis]